MRKSSNPSMFSRIVFLLLVLPGPLLGSDHDCAPISYPFSWFTTIDPSRHVLRFGDSSYPINENLPEFLLKNKARSDVASGNLTRMFGYEIESHDCGHYWSLTSSIIPPVQLAGDNNGNGVLHFNPLISDLPSVVDQPSGFVSDYHWESLNSQIFPLYKDRTQNLSYAPLNTSNIPVPVIGRPGGDVNFYSPSSVQQRDGSILLYFGGWRHDYSLSPLQRCEQIDWQHLPPPVGYDSDLCDCRSSAQEMVDACTGDKIFVSSNHPPGQAYTPDTFHVLSINDTWTADGLRDDQFASIISPARINHECYKTSPERCPYPIVHTNDPTVVRVPHGDTDKYYMYFSGAVLARKGGEAYNFTHTAESDDGIHWGKFSILKHTSSVTFPGDLPYNAANGSVRIRYDQGRAKLILISVTEVANPAFKNFVTGLYDHPDAGGVMVYEIDPSEPNIVTKAWQLDRRLQEFSACSQSMVCASEGSSPKPLMKLTATAFTVGRQLPGWDGSALISRDGIYSSPRASTDANVNGDFAAVWLASPTSISQIRIHARKDNKGRTLGFPQSYALYLTTEDNSAWKLIGDYDLQPEVQGYLTMYLGETITSGVMIVPKTYGQDDFGNRYFQLGEVEFFR